MNTSEARLLGTKINTLLEEGKCEEGCQLLSTVLNSRTPFRLLDVIGLTIGASHPSVVTPFLNRISVDRTMGGWIVIASILQQQTNTDLSGALFSVCKFVVMADVWYAADSFGERVPGHTLVEQFEPTLALLSGWRDHPNRWIRRMVGVSVHYWAKQAHGNPSFTPQIKCLLELFEPMFTEREQDAIKGIGWGLKTLGRFYPEILTDWLVCQVDRPHQALMLRKAVKYLPLDLRTRIMSKAA